MWQNKIKWGSDNIFGQNKEPPHSNVATPETEKLRYLGYIIHVVASRIKWKNYSVVEKKTRWTASFYLVFYQNPQKNTSLEVKIVSSSKIVSVAWCSNDEHSHNQNVLIMQDFKVLVLGGVLVATPSTLVQMDSENK